jgi:single-stranded-DNA-specific exonuclease
MKSYRLRARLHEELLQDLLLAREVVGEEAQKHFLAPDFAQDSGDPFLLPDMEKAVDRIITAVKNNEKVCVWSDYDCDGIPGGVMLSQFLRTIGLEVRHYIPHRHKEGYGLNEEGLEELAGQGIKLVITIDLGTTEVEHIAYANKKGIDVIVTDHHAVPKEEFSGQNGLAVRGTETRGPFVQEILPEGIFAQQLPPAFAVINPKRLDSKYGFDGLCGAAVAWKLIQGVLEKNRFGIAEGQEKWFLDLVGIATLSDMVPLVGENRMLAHFGLRVLRRNRRPGLASLLSLLRIKPEALTEDDIGFMISPRINAASRMDTPQTAARLLATESVEEASALARELNHINDERKGIVAATVKDANRRLADMSIESSVIVMGNPNWRPGILGLVANSLMEAHHKPVFLWGREGADVIKGSCRSDGIVSVVDLMDVAGDVFEGFGGHAASGGFSVLEERVHELGGRLTSAYEGLRAQASPHKDIVLEREVDLAEVPLAGRALKKLAPFGVGNKKPLLLFPGVSIANIRTFGKTQNHLEIALSKGSERISGVSFFSTPDSFEKKFATGERADIVGHIENDWRGRPRLRVVDIL